MDKQKWIQNELLATGAEDVAHVFYRDSTDEVMFVPLSRPHLWDAVKDRIKQGFVKLGMVALMKRERSPEGPLIALEAEPEVSEEMREKIKAAFRLDLVNRGVLEPNTAES